MVPPQTQCLGYKSFNFSKRRKKLTPEDSKLDVWCVKYLYFPVFQMSATISISISDAFVNDPLLAKMNDSNILWGDLLDTKDETKRSPSVREQSMRKQMHRKQIQRLFPVLVRIQSSKELGIQWNIRKLVEWRNANPNPLDWKPYEVKNAKTLIESLRDSGWQVSAPADTSFVCTIRRCHTQSQTSVDDWKYVEPDCPTMVCLNDIKLFFPVIWHKLDLNGCKMYSIELYNDKIRSTALLRSVHPDILTVHISNMLEKTLAQSPAWKVCEKVLNGEFCRLLL